MPYLQSKQAKDHCFAASFVEWGRIKWKKVEVIQLSRAQWATNYILQGRARTTIFSDAFLCKADCQRNCIWNARAADIPEARRVGHHESGCIQA